MGSISIHVYDSGAGLQSHGESKPSSSRPLRAAWRAALAATAAAARRAVRAETARLPGGQRELQRRRPLKGQEVRSWLVWGCRLRVNLEYCKFTRGYHYGGYRCLRPCSEAAGVVL